MPDLLIDLAGIWIGSLVASVIAHAWQREPETVEEIYEEGGGEG